MPAEPRRPLSVTVCLAMVNLAAKLVPAIQRAEWRKEWSAEIWHRWQFLHHAHLWGRLEAYRLLRSCLGVFRDAAWHFASQETIQNRVRECARSPWTCIGGLFCAVLLLATITSGLPATRRILSPHRPDAGLIFFWLHPVLGGSDTGLPPDVIPAWTKHSKLLQSVAPFGFSRQSIAIANVSTSNRLLKIDTSANLFRVLNARPALGNLPAVSGIVIDRRAWVSCFHSDPHVIGKTVRIGRDNLQIDAVLPSGFEFLSRRPSLFIVQPVPPGRRVMAVGRVQPGSTKNHLDRELVKIAQDDCYYFINGQLRMAFLEDALLTPVSFFGIAVLGAAFLTVMVCRVRLPRWRSLHRVSTDQARPLRTAYFLGKLALALLLVFSAGLEWSRSETSVLFGSQDPASGPLLIWLYILATMGVFFWAIADQRARCRVCLRLLCFPVRIGCPGCLLLDWSGTELLCTEGCGVLHVPHLAPSWDEESEHWIPLDESWKELFADSK